METPGSLPPATPISAPVGEWRRIVTIGLAVQATRAADVRRKLACEARRVDDLDSTFYQRLIITLLLRPLLPSVEDMKNIDAVGRDLVQQDKWRIGDDKFAGTFDSPW